MLENIVRLELRLEICFNCYNATLLTEPQMLNWIIFCSNYFSFFATRSHQEEKSFGEHVNPGAKNFYCVELEDKDDKDEKNKKAFKDNIRKMMIVINKCG